MPRKKSAIPWTKTLIVRLSARQHEDLNIAAAGLGLDVSGLVRLIFIEQVPAYIERGRAAEQRSEAARAKAGEDVPPAKAVKGKPGTKAKPTDSDDENVRFVDP